MRLQPTFSSPRSPNLKQSTTYKALNHIIQLKLSCSFAISYIVVFVCHIMPLHATYLQVTNIYRFVILILQYVKM